MPSLKLPRHVAIIMDGNGRWAQARGHTRFFGHIRGARSAKAIIEHCARLKIPHLTLYAFSTENWFRPFEEVSFLMRLLRRHLKKETSNLIKNNIRFRCIGDIARLPHEVQEAVYETIRLTEGNTGMEVVFALSYGGRQEIRDAVVELARQVNEGLLEPEEIDEGLISRHLQSAFLPDPDLVVRTSGENRISNFFLWQSAYSEFYISPKLWPDFTPSDLDDALSFYAKRERRFGRVLSALPGGRAAEPSATT